MNSQHIIDTNQSFFIFETSRSSGKGGQHVNKVESRVTLVWNLEEANIEESILLKLQKLAHHFIQYPIIRISCEEHRSQLKNKEVTVKKLKDFLTEALKEEKKRKKTSIPPSVKQDRLKGKKEKSTIKSSRKRIDPKDL